ncbi:hypothetical protein L6Q79_12825 [bacterium]|nr:hypothetical protein [bacterium]NUN45389.1 hypothetical protein [bacterium]
MNPAHMHLLLNHIPVLALAAATILLIAARWRSQIEWTRLSMYFFVIAGAVSVPVFMTGEPAEKIIENIGGISMMHLESHEDSAVASLIGACILGVLAVIGLFFIERVHAHRLIWATFLIVALTANGLMAWTASLGGKIHHTEIHNGYAPSQTQKKYDDD